MRHQQFVHYKLYPITYGQCELMSVTVPSYVTIGQQDTPPMRVDGKYRLMYLTIFNKGKSYLHRMGIPCHSEAVLYTNFIELTVVVLL